MVAGGMCGWGCVVVGACMVAGGHAWLQGGMCGGRGHAWWGGMYGGRRGVHGIR